MKTVEEKLGYKDHFFKLGQGRIISIDTDDFWRILWEFPDDANDIFELLRPLDIQTIRDQNTPNFLLLIYKLFLKVIEVSNSDKPLDAKLVNNCCRLLTKLLPFLFELGNYSDIEEKLFLQSHYDPLHFVDGSLYPSFRVDKSDILAKKIIHAIVKLLFFKGFTIVPSRASKAGTDSMISITLWEPGIGISAKYQPPDLNVEMNRYTILRLLITLCGTSFYQYPSQVVAKGSTFMTTLVCSLPKIEILSIVCSLMNVMCRSVRSSSGESMLHFTTHSLKFSRMSYTLTCIQLLTYMIVYPLPPKLNLKSLRDLGIVDERPHNLVRLFFGKLHKDQELMFLTSSMINSLKAPFYESESAFTFQKQAPLPPVWSLEIIMLIWELFQCNSKFRDVIAPKFFAELCFILTIYVKHYHTQDKNMTRLIACFLLYLSHQGNLTEELLDHSPKYLTTIPTTLNFNQNQLINTRDFMIIQMCSVLGMYASSNPINPFLATTLIEILYNLIPLLSSENSYGTEDPTKKLNNLNPRSGLSYSACTSLTNMIVKFSQREFLLKASFHPDILALVMRSICIAALKNPQASRMLLFSILKSEKVYDQTWNTIYNFDSEYFSGETLVTIKDDIKEENEEEEKEDKDKDVSFPNTPISRSTTNLTINEEEVQDPPPPSHPQQQGPIFSIGNDSGSIISTDNHLQTDAEMDEYEAESEAIDRALKSAPPTGMTAKARGKQRKEATLSKTWGGIDALRIILTIIIPFLKVSLNQLLSEDNQTNVDTFELAKRIGNSNFDDLISDNQKQINYDFLPASPLVPLKFTWSSISLGWYTSLLLSDLYNSIDKVDTICGGKNKIIKNIASSVLSFGRLFQGTEQSVIGVYETPEIIGQVERHITKVNHWAQTDIKLFKIKAESNSFFNTLNTKLLNVQNQASPATPIFERPNGSLSRRISDLRLTQFRSGSISGLSTPKEEVESYFPRTTRGNSVTSLQSLNTLNRTRSNTPRNSFSM